MNRLIGIFRSSIIEIVFEPCPAKRAKMFSLMFKEIQRHFIPIRPGRIFERNKKTTKHKYSKQYPKNY
jgi:hypothetical protein